MWTTCESGSRDDCDIIFLTMEIYFLMRWKRLMGVSQKRKMSGF